MTLTFTSSAGRSIEAKEYACSGEIGRNNVLQCGNGRIGRLLIPLFLYSKGRLSTPMFYLSAYLEANRAEYYTRLAAITRENDWTGWTVFFLRSIAEQARTNITRVQAILTLYETMKTRVREITRSQHSARIVDALFDRPIFRIGDFATRAGIPKPTAHPLLRQLQDAGLLKQLREGSGRRPAILAFRGLLNTAEGRKVLRFRIPPKYRDTSQWGQNDSIGSQAARGAMLGLNPDMASLATGSVTPGQHLREPARLRRGPGQDHARQRHQARDRGLRPRHALQRRQPGEEGPAQEPAARAFVLDIANALPVRRSVFDFLRSELAEVLPGATWVAAGTSRYQFEVNQWCLEAGGHCRTGLEDKLRFDPTRLAASNAELVKKIVDVCDRYGRRPATPAEARQILGLRPA